MGWFNLGAHRAENPGRMRRQREIATQIADLSIPQIAALRGLVQTACAMVAAPVEKPDRLRPVRQRFPVDKNPVPPVLDPGRFRQRVLVDRNQVVVGEKPECPRGPIATPGECGKSAHDHSAVKSRQETGSGETLRKTALEEERRQIRNAKPLQGRITR